MASATHSHVVGTGAPRVKMMLSVAGAWSRRRGEERELGTDYVHGQRPPPRSSISRSDSRLTKILA